jgi:phospholipase/lecithinase/hemolysin
MTKLSNRPAGDAGLAIRRSTPFDSPLPVAIPAQAPTPAYDNLYVFGDSYCDVGNLFTATGGAVPSAPYYNGRFSNGPIWVDRVASLLGLPLAPSLLGGTNYAFGGAWVTAEQPLFGGAFIPSVPQQVEIFLRRHGGHADRNGMYIVEGGGNDILGTTGGSPQTLAFQIATRLVDCTAMLRQAGARHFIIPNLFNVGLVPAAAGNASFASEASMATNQVVNSLLALDLDQEGIQFFRMDVFGLLNAVQTDPTNFGFTEIRKPCLSKPQCADPERTFFWDMHHPTEFGHVCLASTFENALVQQP